MNIFMLIFLTIIIFYVDNISEKKNKIILEMKINYVGQLIMWYYCLTKSMLKLT